MDRVIGTEYEALVRDRETGFTVPFEGGHGIRALLERMADRFGWKRVEEDGKLIELRQAGRSITLEPGGQFELSGAPLRTLSETKAELDQHCAELAALEEAFPIEIHWRGMNPWQTVDQIQWMPKGRYGIMRRYLPTRGRYGLYMMGLTCTVQANLDYTDEADFARKLRVSTAIGPLVTALFANSPLLGGKPSGYLSFRAHVWSSVDPDRCGLHRWVFDSDAGYADYVDWALDVPLFFVKRDDLYLDMAGKATFRQLIEGAHGLQAAPGDWNLHMSTLFPDTRARPHLELRTADCVPPELIPACPALWKGVLYDDDACDAAWDLVKGLTFDQRVELAQAAAREAIGARRPAGRGTLGDLCRDLVDIASGGLTSQIASGLGEAGDEQFLEPLRKVVRTGRVPAHSLLDP